MKRGALLLLTPAAAHAAETQAVSAAGSLLQVFIGLVAVQLLIAATAWAAKRMGVARGATSALAHVVASASVGTRERVVVVEVGDAWLVVGVAPGRVNALATLPRGVAPAPTTPIYNDGFAKSLQAIMGKRRAD